MSLPGYHLTKVQGYYIITVDRAHANNIRHAQALKTALSELSHGNASDNRWEWLIEKLMKGKKNDGSHSSVFPLNLLKSNVKYHWLTVLSVEFVFQKARF